MENEALQFKTNINCDGCIAKVKPHLDQVAGSANWQVDTSNKAKILTVNPDGIQEAQIEEAVRQAGFNIERLK